MSDSTYLSAPIWRRLAALLYDCFILIAISFLYGALATGIAVALGKHHENYQPMTSHWLTTAGWVLVLMLFYCWFWKKSGQTIGMRTWRLKLVREQDERLPEWKHCVGRAFLAIPCVLLGGIGYWYSFFDPQKRALHDRLSATRVLLMPKET